MTSTPLNIALRPAEAEMRQNLEQAYISKKGDPNEGPKPVNSLLVYALDKGAQDLLERLWVHRKLANGRCRRRGEPLQSAGVR